MSLTPGGLSITYEPRGKLGEPDPYPWLVECRFPYHQLPGGGSGPQSSRFATAAAATTMADQHSSAHRMPCLLPGRVSQRLSELLATDYKDLSEVERLLFDQGVVLGLVAAMGLSDFTDQTQDRLLQEITHARARND